MKYAVLGLLFLSAPIANAMIGSSAQDSEGSCPVPTASLSPLFHGICNQDESEFSSALEAFVSSGVRPETVVDKFGLSPLHWAASLWNLDMVEPLLKAGFSPNQAGGSKRNTPLHSAIKGNHFGGDLIPENQMPVIRLLLDLGKADPSISNRDGETPQVLAERAGRSDIVAFFEEQQKVLSAAPASAF